MEQKNQLKKNLGVAMIAIISGIFVILNQIFLGGLRSTLLSLGSIAVIIIGFPVYAAIKRNRVVPEKIMGQLKGNY